MDDVKKSRYNSIGSLEIDENPELMIFRRHWLHEYNGYRETVTDENIEEQLKVLSFHNLKKSELIDVAGALYRGAVLMNGQIQHLEHIARIENQKHQSLKKTTMGFGGFIVLLLLMYGPFFFS